MQPRTPSPTPAPQGTDAEPAIFLGSELERPLAVPCATGELVVFSCSSPEHPGRNDDAAASFPIEGGRLVLAVADGVGGLPKAAQAARRVLDALDAQLAPAPPRLREALLDALEGAHAAIREDGSGGASTVALVELDGRRLRSYHAGDAAVLVFGPGPTLRLQTVSHSPVGYAFQSGLLSEEQALRHEARHLITNCVGSEEGLWIELGPPLELRPEDTVLLASDGLLDNLRIAELAQVLAGRDLLACAESLVERAHARMLAGPGDGHPSKPDDLTFVLYRAR